MPQSSFCFQARFPAAKAEPDETSGGGDRAARHKGCACDALQHPYRAGVDDHVRAIPNAKTPMRAGAKKLSQERRAVTVE
jgi:hypothetical protein